MRAKSDARPTPGPWYWREIKEKGCSPHANWHIRGIVANSPVSENGGIRGGSEFIATGTAPGNARLIAAAPDLLKALKEITEELEGQYDRANEPGGCMESERIRLCKNAKRAIKKAEDAL